MNTEPHRAWSGKEIAAQLQVKPRNMLTQLGEWTSLGFLTRAGRGTLHTRHTPIDPGQPTKSLNFAALDRVAAWPGFGGLD
jgi:hypothetical protein